MKNCTGNYIKSHLLQLFFSIIFSVPLSSYATQWLDNPLNASIEIDRASLHLGENTRITIKLSLHEGYHAYEDKFALSFPNHKDINIGSLSISPVKKFYDSISKKYTRGVKDSAVLETIIEIPENSPLLPGPHQIPAHLKYQACTKEFCQFPKTIKMTLPLNIITSSNSLSKEKTTLSFTQQLNKGWLLTFLFVFLAGILTSLTPCIFPMIPITLAVIGSDKKNPSILKNFIKSLTYVLGIATTYSILGLVAASTGALFGAFLGNIWVVAFIALVFTFMALSMYGVFEIQTPHILQNYFNKFEAPQFGGEFFKPYIVGLIAGIVASPCVGPVLVSVLTYVAQTRNQILGFWLLFTYAIGMGLLFLFIGTLSHLSNKLPKSGPWLNLSKFIFGFTMLIMALYYLKPVVSPGVFYIIAGIYFVISGALNGGFTRNSKFKTSKLLKGLLIILSIFGLLSISLGFIKIFFPQNLFSTKQENIQKVKGPKWITYSSKEFNEALKSKKPLLIDVYADWCVACHELEKYTFNHAKITNLSKSFVFMKLDATKDSPLIKSFRQKYKIRGLPSILFFSKSGKWLENLTLSEFEDHEKFQKRMYRAL